MNSRNTTFIFFFKYLFFLLSFIGLPCYNNTQHLFIYGEFSAYSEFEISVSLLLELVVLAV